MKTRGRTSIEDLLIKEVGLEASISRPDVPYELGEEEAVEWRRIVNCMPANHFIPANHHMLVLLCEQLIESRRVTSLIRSYCNRKDPINVKTYLDLCKQKDALILSINRLSRSMRLTQQSTFNKVAVNLKRVAAQTIDMKDVEW